jgi:hypothetical protein
MDINLLLPGDRLNQVLERVLPGDKLARELLSSLRTGQSLQAQVLAVPRADLARLLINDLTITARTGRPLTPGQTLTLTVLKAGETPELQVQTSPRPANGQDVLRLALPRQQPLNSTLSGLAQLAERAMPLLNGPARKALLSLLERSIPLRQVSPDTVRQAVKDSGVFAEARMASGQPPAPTDRKALLLQLAAALPPRQAAPQDKPAAEAALTRATLATTGAPPAPLTRAGLLAGSLLSSSGLTANTPAAAAPAAAMPAPEQAILDRLWRLVDASLARIQTHQAASLPADDNAPPAWQLDIPLALPGGLTQAVELRIQREPEAGEEAASEAGWLVTIGFIFPELGPVKAGVRLANGRISSTFWCEQPAAAAVFDRHLPELRAALEAAGLEVSHLAASQGKPPEGNTGKVEDRLLDERV